jgi:hypothetical protein
MLSNFEMMAIALLVVNLFVTIYFNYRRQEDYDDGGMQRSSIGSRIAIPAMPMATMPMAATTRPPMMNGSISMMPMATMPMATMPMAATTRPPMMNGSMMPRAPMMANRSNGPRDN